jgi:hypothetical protein
MSAFDVVLLLCVLGVIASVGMIVALTLWQ